MCSLRDLLRAGGSPVMLSSVYSVFFLLFFTRTRLTGKVRGIIILKELALLRLQREVRMMVRIMTVVTIVIMTVWMTVTMVCGRGGRRWP